ncbi:MAG: DUF4446 family protein [Patescibacteria group bacterium]
MQTDLLFTSIVALLCVVIGARLYLVEKKLKKLFSGRDAQSVEGLVYEHATSIEVLQKESLVFQSAIKDFDERFLFAVQKIGMVRFNPFSNTGGDQSFAIALLDGSDNGFVISGLYLHGQPMVYAKPIEAGVPRYALSDEEKQALGKATNRE